MINFNYLKFNISFILYQLPFVYVNSVSTGLVVSFLPYKKPLFSAKNI